MNKTTLSNEQYKSLVSSICRDIANSGWRPDYIVGITRGGLLPAVMISHYFDVPCETLKVSLRDNSESESNLWMAEDAYNGKKILIVDDINDSGATLNWIIQDWPSGCMPNNPAWSTVWGNTVRFAVVVDNLASDLEHKVDYAGMEINKAENDSWIEFSYENWWAK
jgi:xanthine phosphoribosyltransferase